MSEARSRHARRKELFLRASELAPGERLTFLREECAGDPDLLHEVEEMLGAEVDTAFLEQGALAAGFATSLGQHPGQIGPYRVLGVIGEGGMGIVYEAEQERPRRKVALKVLQPGLQAMLPRLEQEAEVLGRLQHPGIAHVYESGQFEGPSGPQPYVAMELVRGSNLLGFADQKQLTVQQRLELLIAVIDAVYHAHRQGVIHRDLKPDNVLVTAEGQPKVLDFGIARVGRTTFEARPQDESVHEAEIETTQVGQVVGTLAYMSPEQARGEAQLNTSADVHALGVLAFELLSGRRPHDLQGLSVREAVERICEEPPARLGEFVPASRGELELIIHKAIAPVEADRYASAFGFAADLRRFLRHEPVLAHPTTALYQVRKFAQRNRTLVAGVVATLVAVLVGVTAALWFAWDAGVQRDVASWLAYRLAVRSALSEQEKGRHAVATGLLRDAPPEHRGWEWLHASAALAPWQKRIPLAVGMIGNVTFLPDGRRVVTALRDGSIGMIDLATGQLTRPFPVDAKLVTVSRSIATNPSRLAAGAEDGTVYIWNLDTRALSGVFKAHTTMVWDLDWSTDGTLFSADAREVYRWSGDGPVKVGNVPRTHRVRRLAIAPDKSAVFALQHFFLVRWDLRTGQRTEVQDRKVCEDMVCPTDGRILLTTLYQNLRVRSASDLVRIDKDQGHVRATRGLSLSPDGRSLAAVSHDGTVTIYEAESLDPLAIANGGTPLRHVTFHPGGRGLLCTGHRGFELTTWRLPLASALVLRNETGNVDALLWSPDGRLLVTMDSKEHMAIWDALTGERLSSSTMTPLAFSDDSMHLFVWRQKKLHVIDLANGSLQLFRGHGQRSSVEAFHHEFGFHPRNPYHQVHPLPALGLQATLSRAPKCFVTLRRANHPPVEWTTMPKHGCVRFSRDGRLLAVGSSRGEVAVWDMATGHRRDIPSRVKRWILGIDFSPDGSRMALACHDNVVRLYDTRTWEFVVELRGHTSHVASVMFSPDGSRLASASGDATARIWDTLPPSQRGAEARSRSASRRSLVLRLPWLQTDGLATAAARAREQLDGQNQTLALQILRRRCLATWGH